MAEAIKGLRLEEWGDPELIRAFLDGNEAAFEVLYSRYKRQLYAFLNHLAGDAGVADEIFSETWLRAIDKLARYRDDGKFSAWLFRIARNLFTDRCRRVKRRAEVALNDEAPPPVAAPVIDDPREFLANCELGEEISRALQELPDQQREVFLLRYEDFSFKEIAEMQNCSINTVLSRMQYALRALRRRLQETEE